MDTRKTHHSALLTLLPLTLGHTLLTLAAFPSLGVRWFVAWPVLYALAAALYFLQYTRPGRFVLPCLGVLSVVPAVIWYKCFSYLLYDFFTALQRSTGHIYLVDAPQGRLWPLWVFFVLGGAVLQAYAAYKDSVLWLSPMLLPVLEGSVLAVLPVGWGTAVLVIGVLLRISLRGRDLRASLHGGLAVLLCAALTAGAATALRDAPQQKAVRNLRDSAHTLVYDRRTNSMPEGRLGKLPAWNKNDTPALRVTMEQPQAMYFRGAIYETYTGDAWQPLPAEARASYGALFSWLHSEDYYGQTAVYTALRAQNRDEPQRVTVENLSACRSHGYLPYGAGEVAELDETLIGDALLPSGAHSFTCVPTDPDTLLEAAKQAASASAVSDMERSYAAYALNVDRDMPQAAVDALAASFTAPRDDSVAQTLHAIRTYLRKTLVYDETVETRAETDFVRQTLTQKRGYSVHYATLAVLLLRYCGIPARYAEGYYLSAAEAGDAADGTVVLTEQNAHAWAEYYLDGVGFVPFEVTPGYAQTDDPDNDTQDPAGPVHTPRSPIGAPTLIPEPTPEEVPMEVPEEPVDALSWRWLLCVPPLLLGAWIALRRLRLRRMLRRLDDCDDRESIQRKYAYAAALRKFCPVCVPGSKEALALFREAKFSDHAMDASHRARMTAYCDEVRFACLRKWNRAQRFWYRYLRAILE